MQIQTHPIKHKSVCNGESQHHHSWQAKLSRRNKGDPRPTPDCISTISLQCLGGLSDAIVSLRAVWQHCEHNQAQIGDMITGEAQGQGEAHLICKARVLGAQAGLLKHRSPALRGQRGWAAACKEQKPPHGRQSSGVQNARNASAVT